MCAGTAKTASSRFALAGDRLTLIGFEFWNQKNIDCASRYRHLKAGCKIYQLLHGFVICGSHSIFILTKNKQIFFDPLSAARTFKRRNFSGAVRTFIEKHQGDRRWLI
jgi:hypothetical protein